jgi:hypothetical protein
MEPQNLTELEQELYQYLEDNSDMIWGTDFIADDNNFIFIEIKGERKLIYI